MPSYGNHTYGCANQQEYDKVMSVMDEAYNYACQQEAKKTRRGGLDSLAKEGTDSTIFYQQQLGITNKQQIISMRVTESKKHYATMIVGNKIHLNGGFDYGCKN